MLLIIEVQPPFQEEERRDTKTQKIYSQIEMSSSRCLPLLPISASFFLLIAMLSSYLLDVLYKDSGVYAPYPSQLALEQPEQGVFTVCIALSGSFTFSVVLIRFLQVNAFYPMVCFKSNIISFVFGMTMLIGLYLVPSFAQDKHPYVHYVGAAIYFLSMLVFMVTQTRITAKHPYNHTKCLGRFRIVLSVLACSCPIVYLCARCLVPDGNRYYIAQGSECFIYLLFLIFLSTFAWDFGRIHLRLNSYEVCPRSPDTRKITRNKPLEL